MTAVSDIVDQQVAAFRARDLEAFLSCYAADCAITDGEGNVLMDGIEAMRGPYGQLFGDSPDLKLELPRRIVVGDYVLDEEQITGFHLAGFPTDVHAAVVYHVRDGRIARVQLLM